MPVRRQRLPRARHSGRRRQVAEAKLPEGWDRPPAPERWMPQSVPLVWNVGVTTQAIRQLVSELLRPQHHFAGFEFVNAYQSDEERRWVRALADAVGLERQKRTRCPRCGEWTRALVQHRDGAWVCWERKRAKGRRTCPDPRYPRAALHAGVLVQAYRFGLRECDVRARRRSLAKLLVAFVPKARRLEDMMLLGESALLLQMVPRGRRGPWTPRETIFAPRSATWLRLRDGFALDVVDSLWHPEAYRSRYGALVVPAGAGYGPSIPIAGRPPATTEAAA